MSAWSLVVAAACWGVATAISKRASDEIAPLTLLPIQLAMSVAGRADEAPVRMALPAKSLVHY
jgi:hypothetical protein